MKRSFAIACVFLIMLIIIFLPTGNYVLQESLYLQEQKINTVKYTIVTNPDSDEDSDVLREENPYEVADVTQGGIGGGNYDWGSDEDAPQWGNDAPNPEQLQPGRYFDLPIRGLNEKDARFSMWQSYNTPTYFGPHRAWDFGNSSTFNASGGAINVVVSAKPGRIAFVRNGRGSRDASLDTILRYEGSKIDGQVYEKTRLLWWAGNVVVVAHDDGTRSCYAHLRYDENTSLRIGDTVIAGSPLGIIGNTGNSGGAHLHWEIKSHGYGNVTSMSKSKFMDSSQELRKGFGNSSDWEITPKIKWNLSTQKGGTDIARLVGTYTYYYVVSPKT